ncbi:RNA-directed DNA polymerase from mobile element jockey [Trichonephila clavipes]|nr:RNA-directed DNA polymerase from mobile element jockey [Trichonephila clavipes]
MEELEAAIAKMNPGKAPGPDVIFGRMVQHFEILQKKNYWKFLTFHGLPGKLPKIWKLSTVIPILKPNKNASECKNYRPISLTSTLCKLMERVIHRRLMNWLIENKKLHFYQTAFRTHHSTTDQLFYLNQSIIDGFQERPLKKTLAVFLDISAAFDRVWRQRLVHTIQGTGINGKALLWINDFLSGRKFSVCGTSWGSRPQTLKSTFCTVIRPVLEYATPIWTPASISVKRKLDSVQHRATKIIIEQCHQPIMKRPNKNAACLRLKGGADLPLSSSLINYAHMVWTISLEEFLINGSILQGSKDLRLSNLIVESEKNSIWIIPP